MSEEDFIVGYTIFKGGGFRTRYQHFDNLEVAKMFTSNVNLKDTSKIYVPLELYEKQQKEIEYYKDELEKESSIWTKIEKGNDYISKDKVRDIIKCLEHEPYTAFDAYGELLYDTEIDIKQKLNKLLEE